jgi:hypothetical protein
MVLTPIAAILMFAGWSLAGILVKRVGIHLYDDPLIYLYGSERKGMLPIVLTWLPLATAVAGASVPWIVFDLIARYRNRRLRISEARSN